MLTTLGRVAREARLEAGCAQMDIATTAGVSDGVISNLELGIRYPERLDPVVSAYEQLCGLASGDLWRRAAARL